MSLKPWYKVVTPREDLREGKPLDASEFAVHLDDVRNGSAPPDYQKPDRFFANTPTRPPDFATYCTNVLGRLTGDSGAAAAIFRLYTSYGDGKTHGLALTLGLLFRVLAGSMRSRDNLRNVVEGIEQMGQEEAAYWLGMAMHRKHSRRVLTALRVLLTVPKPRPLTVSR